jgi:excisionase family DNA binding protein
MKLKITKHDLRDSLAFTKEQLWRSLEHVLRANNREYEFTDAEGAALVSVFDEADAYLLGDVTRVCGAELINDLGAGTRLEFDKPKKLGRAKNSVFVKSQGKSMSMNKYAKQLKSGTISKSEIIKRGFCTKATLEKAIASGTLSVVKVGRTERISLTKLQEYLNMTYDSMEIAGK